MVVLLIALLVVKPEQLPDVAHSLGRFVKSIRGIFAKVKNEMNELIDPIEKIAGDRPEKK
jgi:Sec-independent protein translocase protein TatA